MVWSMKDQMLLLLRTFHEPQINHNMKLLFISEIIIVIIF